MAVSMMVPQVLSTLTNGLNFSTTEKDLLMGNSVGEVTLSKSKGIFEDLCIILLKNFFCFSLEPAPTRFESPMLESAPPRTPASVHRSSMFVEPSQESGTVI